MKRIPVTLLALAVASAAGVAFAAQDYGSRYDNNGYPNNGYATQPRSDVATVVSAQPIYDQYSSQGYQRQECWNEQTNGYDNGYYRNSQGQLYRGGSTDSNANGTLIGALIGGALGNQVGKGDGKTAATIGGAVIGGAIGNNVDRNHEAGSTYNQYQDNSGVIRRCRTVTDPSYNNNVVSGYRVTYRYAGQTYTSMTRYRPSRTIRVVVDVRPQENYGGNRGR